MCDLLLYWVKIGQPIDYGNKLTNYNNIFVIIVLAHASWQSNLAKMYSIYNSLTLDDDFKGSDFN